ncbi:class I SAM-dependent methyltransferase [[Actinomadura] parvosata]|uniref:class I SAM-dependent methyltransferase n=1 Tax=[Actinomadura] parvosata TaxID=1955412 RepID=UPI00406C95F3
MPGTASTSRTIRARLAVEPEPRLRRQAQAAAADAAVAVEVVPGLAARLPAADHSVDAAVFCLVLCSLPDVAAALAEARRVLRPDGQLRFLEHGRADTPTLARVQWLLDARTPCPPSCLSLRAASEHSAS